MEIQENKRKIVNLNYSFWVSLPINWIKNHKIAKGDYVKPIILENGDLLLKPIKEVFEDDTINKARSES